MRGWLILTVIAIILTACPPALAEGDKPNPFGGWVDLSIWTAVVFLLLLFVLSKTAWPWMLQGLAKREHDIASAVEDARKAREETAQLRLDLEEVRQKGYEEVRTLLQKAREDADRLKEQRKAEAEAEIQANRERLRRELDTARDQALHQLWEQAADLAVLVSSKVVQRQLSADDHRALIDEALGELKQAAKHRQQVVASVQT